MMYSKICGTGSYLPPQVMTNEDWVKRVDTSNDWILERTGIAQRHIASQEETTSNMAAQAAKKALQAANLSPESIQLIIVATSTSDRIFPSTACLVQRHLNIPHAIAFDVQAACTGFIYALSIADQFIKTTQVVNALVIGSEIMSRLIDWKDRSTCVLFGDGAGAVVLKASLTPGILQTKLHANGSASDILEVDNVQIKENKDVMEYLNEPSLGNAHYPFIKMQGRQVFKEAVSCLGKLVSAIQQDPKLAGEPIDWLIPHQANIRIIKATAEKLGVPMDKVICTVESHANTSSASIPLALDTALRDGRIQAGHNLLFEAFGGGLTWGSAFVKF